MSLATHRCERSARRGVPQQYGGDPFDPAEASQVYRDRVTATKGKHLDDAGRRNLAEDLLSPCTEQVAVFQQFSKAVHESWREFVVFDTAPDAHPRPHLRAAQRAAKGHGPGQTDVLAGGGPAGRQPRKWMTHCHNIYHAEAGMMIALNYRS